MKYKNGDILRCKFNFELGLDGEAWVYIGSKENMLKDGVDDNDIFACVNKLKEDDIVNDARLIEIIEKVKWKK